MAAIALVAAVLGVVAGRATGSSDGGGGGGSGEAAGGKKIDVIIKASDSSFWQVMLAGAKQLTPGLGPWSWMAMWPRPLTPMTNADVPGTNWPSPLDGLVQREGDIGQRRDRRRSAASYLTLQ